MVRCTCEGEGMRARVRVMLASSPGHIFISKYGKIGPGIHCQGPSAHALAITREKW